jgi:hypothetical protein
LVYFVVIFIPSSGFYYVFYFKKLVATTWEYSNYDKLVPTIK